MSRWFSTSDGNTRIVRRNMISAFLIRGGGLAVSLISTPAYIRYFDHNEVLGVWYTLLSVLMWFLHFDLGIGNGLRIHLTRALAAGERSEARRVLSAGVFSMGGVALILWPVGMLLIGLVDLNRIYGIPSEIIRPEIVFWASALVFAGLMVRFLLGSVTAVLYALQKSAITHLSTLGISVLQCVFVLVVRPPDPETGLLWLSGAYAILSNVPLLVAGLVVFGRNLRDCRPCLSLVDRASVRRVMSIGIVYFACSVFHLIIVHTNEFLISILFGASSTTDYTIGHKLADVVYMALTPALTPVWSVVTKAESEGDREWLCQAYRRLKLLGTAAVLGQVILAFLWPLALRLWLSDAVPPAVLDMGTAVAFAVFGAVFSYSTMLSSVACGLARLRRQFWCYLVGAVSKIVWIVILAPIVGDWRLVLWCNTAALLPYCIVEGIGLSRFFKEVKREKYTDL